MSDADNIVREFLQESRENVDSLDRDLLALEQASEDAAIVARIFRALHTIKGTCGFLGFSRLESVSHAAENVLSLLRDEELCVSPALIAALLATADVARVMLDAIESTGTDGDNDHAELVDRLHAVARGEAPAAPAPAPIVVAAPAVQAAAVAAPAPPAAESTIRVDVELLDKMMTLVGELVLARNQIVQLRNIGAEPTFASAAQQLDHITSELQDSVMKTRMQPIGNVWSKFPRVIRDLAAACGKQVELVMQGEHTELDKTLLEAIKDPLTHLVRNSVDHGIETADVRVARGKSPAGRLTLRAFHEGGQVILDILDDGGGIDPARIAKKAIERGLVTADHVGKLSERDLLRLIFLPGFSTAEKVTNVSGRGVGMDVVRTNIEKIGGTIELGGKVGAGTTIRIRIPLTLAIIPAVVIASGGNRYAIPQGSVQELVRLDGVELVHGAPVVRLRGNLLPLVYLADTFAQPRSDAASTLVVLQSDAGLFGLVVDAVHNTEEIVVKPIAKQLACTQVFSGATIMGDGRVALILDVAGLAERARVSAEATEQSRAAESTSAPASELHTFLVFRGDDDSRIAVPLSRVARLEEISPASLEVSGDELVIQYRDGILPVVRLSDILIDRRSLPRTTTAPARSELLQLVVFANRGTNVGLVVGDIVDIVDLPPAETTSRRESTRPGALGSIVILGRITELLDVDAVLAYAAPYIPPTLFQAHAEVSHGL